MTKTEITKLIDSQINKYVSDKLDKEMKKVLSSSRSETRDELIKTIKNSLESVYKMLWQKRDFWKTDIK